ncbi:PAS domain S-box protein [Gigaspora margarita]|uniref:PAS domain S-box protein n=1 Tax=Gigaspora margarita TaxID=4874 RepID=A0A8H4ELD1_GIGMA|nr:PAS domain S-box protein [Gigaspora margarita]
MSTYRSNTENKESDFANTVYNYDWSSTLFGPMELWDTSLKNAVTLSLHSVFPINICVYPNWIYLYNKAWQPILKTKHPSALGKPVKEVWPEIYEIIDEQLEKVRTTGKGIFYSDCLFELQRDGYTEEAYFNYTYSPIFKSDGSSVCAVFVMAQENTQKVLNNRRLKIVGEFGRRITEVESLENASHIITEVLSDHNADIPYALIYFVEHKLNTASESLIARLIATTFDCDGEKGWLFPNYLPETPAIIDLTKDVNKSYNTYPEVNRETILSSFIKCDSWPLHLLIEEGGHIMVLLKDGSQAVLLLTKIPLDEGRVLSAILICGINRRRKLDEKYMEFLKVCQNSYD